MLCIKSSTTTRYDTSVFKAKKHVIRITCHNYSIVLPIILHCYRHYTVLAIVSFLPKAPPFYHDWINQNQHEVYHSARNSTGHLAWQWHHSLAATTAGEM